MNERETINTLTQTRAHVYKLLSGPGNKNGPLRKENSSLMGVIYIIILARSRPCRRCRRRRRRRQ